MTVVLKPVMLAPNEQVDFDQIKYPQLASPKYDGIRCLCICGELYSRSQKPLPNIRLQERFKRMIGWCKLNRQVIDCELYDHQLDHHAAHTSFTQSHNRKIPDTLKAYIFDMIDYGQWKSRCWEPFNSRYEKYMNLLKGLSPFEYHRVNQWYIDTPTAAEIYFKTSLAQGYEGIILRNPTGVYKHGRATIKENLIYKFKEWHTADGKIVEIIQRRKLKEGIPRTTTPTGYTERVFTKGSYELDDMVGAFMVEFEDGTISEVNYGRGFTHNMRREHWRRRNELIGRMVEVRHLPHGAKDKIRIGSLVRFRGDKE